MAGVTGCALNVTHAKPTNSDGGEDGLSQRGGRNGVNMSRKDTAAHGLHHAHAERKVSRLDREGIHQYEKPCRKPSLWKALLKGRLEVC